jgi:hypothetical protein
VYNFSVDDVAWLRSTEGSQVCRQLETLEWTEKTRIADIQRARGLSENYQAAVETVLLRRKARRKLTDVEDWLFTDAAVQQATPTPVARHRARRLTGRVVHDITCSIGADLATIAQEAALAIGSDLDPVRLRMARHNCLEAYFVQADALVPVTRGTVVVADPARRDEAGNRKWRPDALSPPLDELIAAYPGRDLSIKCAPGLDFDAVGWADEIELVSLDGGVKEACLWRGSVATAGVFRRATVLRSDGGHFTVTDAESDDCAVRPVGKWLLDPDGAIVRAGLVRHYAARHGLWQIDERIAYLSGDQPPAGVRAFRVLDSVRYSEKAVRQLLRAHDVGAIEILTRGVAVTPDVLRRKLKLAGSRSLSMIITRIGDVAMAYLAQAERV